MKTNLSNLSSKSESVRYLVKIILLSELPSWNTDQQAFIEDELDRLTAGGEELISVLPDHGDLLVILKVTAQGTTASPMFPWGRTICMPNSTVNLRYPAVGRSPKIYPVSSMETSNSPGRSRCRISASPAPVRCR